MSSKYLTCEIFPVNCDATDWPKGLPEAEREPLQQAIREVLAEAKRPLGTHEISECLKRDHYEIKYKPLVPIWYSACLWDFIHACVYRACRAMDLCQRWTPDEPKKTAYGNWTVTVAEVRKQSPSGHFHNEYAVHAKPESMEERVAYRAKNRDKAIALADFFRANLYACAAAWEHGTPVPALPPIAESLSNDKTLVAVFSKEEEKQA